MILLLGGTADTRRLARRLIGAGRRLLVSTTTDIPLDVGGAGVRRRCGPLDDAALTQLIHRHAIETIVDATHPYAGEIRERACRIAAQQNIRYLTLVRPPVIAPDEAGVEFADDHPSAARRAFAHGRPVLVTIGSRHIQPYTAEAAATALPLFVRVLDHPASRGACRSAGLSDDQILTGRGPFTTQQNIADFRRHRIGVVVTKDSGQAGGTREKLAAARETSCRIVVIRRPPVDPSRAFRDVDTLMAALEAASLQADK